MSIGCHKHLDAPGLPIAVICYPRAALGSYTASAAFVRKARAKERLSETEVLPDSCAVFVLWRASHGRHL
jgi:hypothetical protein